MAGDRQVNGGEPFVFSESSFLKTTRVIRTEDGVDSWDLFEPPDLTERPGDLSFVIDRPIRPEQISLSLYNDENLWWVIALANNIRVPYSELYPGRTLRIPDPAYVFSLVRSQEELV